MSTAVVFTGAGSATITELGTTTHSPLVPSAQPRLRLTKRGRAVFTTLAAVPVVVAAIMIGLNGGGATATSSSGAPLEQVTLEAGQSLWQLAETIAPSEDPREVVRDILSVNQLDSASVQAGQRLDVPAEYSAE